MHGVVLTEIDDHLCIVIAYSTLKCPCGCHLVVTLTYCLLFKSIRFFEWVHTTIVLDHICACISLSRTGDGVIKFSSRGKQ